WTPSMVLIRIGNTVPTTISETFISSVMPKTTTASGSSAVAGIDIPNRIIGLNTAAARGEIPRAIPAQSPTTTEISQPCPARARLEPRSVVNCSVTKPREGSAANQLVKNAPADSVNVGKYG